MVANLWCGNTEPLLGVSIGPSGVYVAGQTNGALPGFMNVGDTDIFVRKFDFDGNVLWTQQFGTVGLDSGLAISASESGIYVAGVVTGLLPSQVHAGAGDAFLRKYDPDGNVVWTRQFGTFHIDQAFGVSSFDAEVLVSGQTCATLPGQVSAGGCDAFVRKYDSQGNQLWTRQFGTTASTETATGVIADATGIHVTGVLATITGSFQLPHMFARKFDADGNDEWTITFGDLGAAEETAWAIATEAANVYVAGQTRGTISGEGTGAFVLRIGTNEPPVANAGVEQRVECTMLSATPVTLDGSASSDPNNDGLTYTWTGPFPEGGGTVTGATPTVSLLIGTHTITLTVDDGKGGTDSDTVEVSVALHVEGLLAPLAALVPEGSAAPAPDKAFKQGSTLPLKLQLTCGGMAVTDANVAPPRIVGLMRNGDALDLTAVDLDARHANDSGALFRFSAPNWVFNLSTKGFSPGSYTITIQLPDGQRYDAAFVLR